MSEPELLPYLGERFAVLRHIGSGGMGHVYLARDTKHNRQVAIKVVRSDLVESVSAERFHREIEIAAGLSHPNIVPLYDSGEVDGQLYYVMPFIEGESLRQRLDREVMLPTEQVVQWALEIGGGLAFLHSHGLVHRDIKPQNLLMQAGRVLIADLGIAKAANHAAAEGITGQNVAIGTPVYMSPEQASGGIVDGRSDMYSLACVVYEMLVGEPPFHAPTAQGILAKKLSGRFPAIRVVRPSVPRSLERTLTRALAPVPADRFPTMEEFCRSLAAARPIPVRQVTAAAAAALVVGAIVWVGMTRESLGKPQPMEHRRVVVGKFDNRTGDTRYEALGIMAADWITEGLQRTGAVEVVPTLTALSATRFLDSSGPAGDPVRALARETQANLVVSGSIYSDHDTLILQAQLADARAGRLVGAVQPVRVHPRESIQAIQELRARLMGLLALSLDDRVLQDGRPPTYPAYAAFSQGMDAYVRSDYLGALAAFEQAYASDTSFVLPLLYASLCHSNQGDYASADSVLRVLARHRDRLNAHDRFWVDYRTAELAGNDAASLEALRGAARLAPSSKATFNFAVQAFEARLPFPAESAIRRLPPDVGPMRGWLPYWEVLTSALHVQGKYRQEVSAAREAHRRYPGRLRAYLFEGRALAAMKEIKALEQLWERALGEQEATPVQLGDLAYDWAAELWAHGDSIVAREWFQRAYARYGSRGEAMEYQGARWGRARAATRLGRLREAYALSDSLAAADTSRHDYAGWHGVVAARLGNRRRAEEMLKRLAGIEARFSFGEPQVQAAKIAIVLGETARAESLLTAALGKGYPYDIEFHRDDVFAGFQGSLIMRRMSPYRE